MAFSGATEFAKGRARVSTTDTAQAIFTGPGFVSGFVIRNTSGTARIVTFRATADVPVYFRVKIPASSQRISSLPWYAEAGLEVIGDDFLNSSEVTVFFVKG